MAIEFLCTRCGSKLRVPDEATGKQARCPKCGSVENVPGSSAADAKPDSEPQAGPAMDDTSPFAPGWQPPPRNENPFAAPQTEAFDRSGGGHAVYPLDYRKVSFEQLFSDTFAAFGKTWGLLLLAWLAIGVVGFGIGILFLPLQIAAAQVGERVVLLVDGIHQLVSLAWTFVSVPVFARFAVHVVRGDPNPERGILPPLAVFLHTFLASILYSVCVTLGLILLIVPGIVVSLMFLFAMWITADREVNAIDAFSISYRATEGNKLTLLAAFLVAGLAGIVLVVLTCGLGALVVMPFNSPLQNLVATRGQL